MVSISISTYGAIDIIQSSRWINGTNMQVPRSEIAGVSMNESIYIIGGFEMKNDELTPRKTDLVESYNIQNNKWYIAAHLPQKMDHVAADKYNGKIYVVGGIFGKENNKSHRLFIYDPTIDKWQEGKQMPTARGALTANFIDGILYAVGGLNSTDSTVSTNEAYDPTTDTWTTKAPMPTARDHAASAVVDGKLYVIGGRITNTSSSLPFLNLDNNEAYNARTDTWLTLEPMPSKRSGLSATSINSSIYVFGGQTPLRTYDNNEKYDTKGDSWISQSPMPTPRHGLAAISDVIRNNIYVIGGGTEAIDSVSNITEIFFPSH
jgi:N-acetylneuraminic acid mutarotase